MTAAVKSGTETTEKQLIIWPEWNDSDVNTEKWEPFPKGKSAVS